jgi:hypothetical protein
MELILGRGPINIWVFVAEIANEFIVGLDVLSIYAASVNLGRHTLRLGDEEVFVSRSRAIARSCRLVLGSEQVMPTICNGVVMTRPESPLGVKDGLI